MFAILHFQAVHFDVEDVIVGLVVRLAFMMNIAVARSLGTNVYLFFICNLTLQHVL